MPKDTRHSRSRHPYSPPAHHNGDGTFRNPHLESWGGGMLRFFKARLGGDVSWANHEQHRERIPVRDLDPAQLHHPPPAAQVTWIGHSTFLLQYQGLNILTDPVFSDRVSPLSFAGPKRLLPLPVTLEQLPPIDLVVISHNHYDHLDRDRYASLAIVPLCRTPGAQTLAAGRRHRGRAYS